LLRSSNICVVIKGEGSEEIRYNNIIKYI
jgi:hypothetical protein